MNEVWNLDPIYHGFDDPAFERDMQVLKASVSGLETFARNLSGMDPTEGLREGLLLQEQLSSLLTGWVDEADISWEAKFRSIDYAAVFTPKQSFWKRLDVFDWFEK